MPKCTTVLDFNELVNRIRDTLVGNYPMTGAGLAIGSTATHVANAAFTFSIAGVQYQEAALVAGTAPGNDVIPVGTFGAVAFDIGADGTVDVIEASANATGYVTAAIASAALADPLTGHARMGFVTASKSDGAFTFGTTDLDAANTTVAYTDGDTTVDVIGDAAT